MQSITSSEPRFLKRNSIKHITTIPSNGCIEHAVQVFKGSIRKIGEGSLVTKLSSNISQPLRPPLESHLLSC